MSGLRKANHMRKSLDTLYLTALWLSALCLAVIALLVGAQILGRIVDNVLIFAGYRRYGFIILSLSEICGFLLGASTFLALAGSLKAGAHIRVTLFLQFFPENVRRWIEILALSFAAGASFYATWFLGRLMLDSIRFNEVSVGLQPIPLAWPQAALVAGVAILTIAFLDELVHVVRGGRPTFRAAEDAIALGKEG